MDNSNKNQPDPPPSAPSWPPPTDPIPSAPLPEQNSGLNFGQQPQYVDPNTTTLDNPYGAPVQPPPIDGGMQNSQNPSTYQPIAPSVQSEPVWSPPQTPSNEASPFNQPEQAPTDLSHLISSSDANTQAAMQSEAVVIPQMGVPEVPTMSTESKGGIPKWIIGLGVGLLILVAGASAYFILGIGQQPKNTSLPATEAPKVSQQGNAPASTPIPAPQAATESANFGELQGSQAAPQASSAADIIKARQQQGQ